MKRGTPMWTVIRFGQARVNGECLLLWFILRSGYEHRPGLTGNVCDVGITQESFVKISYLVTDVVKIE